MSQWLGWYGAVAAVVVTAGLGCRTRPDAPPPVQPPAPLPPPVPRSTAQLSTQPSTRPGVNLPPVALAPPPPRVTRRAIGDAPKDPQPAVQLTTRFEIYDIVLPVGSVSRSDAFWKLIDEDQIDPAAYDTLRRNGVRIGVAPVTEWPAMRDLIDDVPSTTRQSSATGRELMNLEVSLKRDIVAQNIFVFTAQGTLVGRSFDRCENLLAISFQQTPRKPGQVRVAMSPIVRSMRKLLTYSALGNEQEWAFTYPERAIELNLRADVPLDHVLVIAPSEEARTPGSLGQAFLVQDGPAEKQEHVLVMVPRMFRVENER